MKTQATVICDFEGIHQAKQNNDIIIVVDVLRFSSAVTTAIANGFEIIPSSNPRAAQALAQANGFALAGKTNIARYSLSPLDYVNPACPETVVLVSPNGAHCVRTAGQGTVFIGCFLNAGTAARIAGSIAQKEARSITLVAAGEASEDQYHDLEKRRFAIEDYLGCGMILSEMQIPLTAEAEVCKRTFEACCYDYARLITAGLSGQYLVSRGHEADIIHCMQKSIYSILPIISGEKIVLFRENVY